MSKTPEYLKSLREKVNWENEQERDEFVEQLYPLVKDWQYQLPRLRDIFRKEEIEYLLTESIKYMNMNYYTKGRELFDFVLRTGYKDEPEVDEDNKLVTRRTPVHHVTLDSRNDLGLDIVRKLILNVYDRSDVVYSSHSGMTHFHVACIAGSAAVVEKFLDSGRDPNYPVGLTGDTPLILALIHRNAGVVELLLRRGASPNLANAKGSTPLHVLCKYGQSLEEFFKVNDDIGLTVQVDPRDKLGRTPLQCAVACLCTHTVGVLLARGADLSKFVFPTAAYLGKRRYRPYVGDKFNEAFSVPIIVASLEKRGYEFSHSDALTIMKYFARRKLFALPTDVVHPWYKNATIRENLSLHDLIQLRSSKEALRLVTFEDFVSLRRWSDYWSISSRDRETCAAILCEKLSRGFLKRWTLEPFMELIHCRLPILCCEMIIDDLSNEDLLNICQAAAAMRTKRKPNGKKGVATNVTTTANKRPVRVRKAPKRLQHK